ncbi:MAG TPA: nucleotidyl transferase AbiEii/AbiGii toxin family protein, partial [Solirubrobacterales bacterium]
LDRREQWMTGTQRTGQPVEQPSLPEKVIVVHESLAEARIPHALGGALALAYYADPRATIDIDINVFVPTERWKDVVDALTEIGVSASRFDPSALERDGQCRLWWGDNAVDLFFAYDPIHDEMRRQSRRVPFGGVTVSILSPEHLAVCKAMFDRRKDWIDIEQMLIAGDDLDLSEIEKWLVRMVGDSDQRVKRLRNLGLTPHE